METHPSRFSLLTDLYELTMAACYHRRKMFGSATFSLFIREYPPDRGYLVSAGLEDVLAFLQDFSFSQEDLDYLAGTGMFSEPFLDYLRSLRFTGDVVALPEGSLFFRDEPVLEVTAPITEAQLVETYIINQMNMQVSLATKAARCVHAAGGRNLLDFSLRRTQGTDAGNKVARSSYLAGFAAHVLGGLIGGGWIGGSIAGASASVRTHAGLCLLPQAGVALGLALIVGQRFPEPGPQVLSIFIATTIVFEIVGPVVTRFALRHAGELAEDEGTENKRDSGHQEKGGEQG